MDAAKPRCKKCQSEMRIESIADVSGVEGDVKVEIRRLPALACARGHRRFVRPEFPAQLLARLASDIKVPAGRGGGFLFKSYHCGGCGEKLPAAATSPRTFNIDVKLEGVDPIPVALTVPVCACPSCGREQVRSLAEVSRQTPAAMARAFQSAEIPPG